MKSRWSEVAAARAVVGAGEGGISEELALRTYSARLLGADPSLVLHGGGNTSVKATVTDLYGEPVSVIHVKGSGWDLATIEPAGHPAVRMAPLLRMLTLPSMTDEAMVNGLRLALLDAGAPTPSVETLLHAALPARFIDHTHANAVLGLVDQENARALSEAVFGDSLLFIPYVMPGFGLARACKDAWDAAVLAGRSPTVMVLERHGIFTFGDSARESYERMVQAVSRAEAFAEHSGFTSAHTAPTKPAFVPAAATRPAFAPAPPAFTPEPAETPSAAILLPRLRGALARAAGDRPEHGPILTLRTSPRILAFLARPDLRALVDRGCATPDHVLRTKPWPLVLASDIAATADAPATGTDLEVAVSAYASRYESYVADAVAKKGERTKLDPWPRVILAPGIGIVTAASTLKEATIAADVYEHTIDVMERAQAIGRYSPVSLDDLFDVEYWSLEQAKLKKVAPPPLGRRVALVTGAASGIGRATVERLLALGAHVVACDRIPTAGLRHAALVSCEADVLDPAQVARAFDLAATTFGGVDLVVSNAGSALEGKLESESGEAALRASLDLNLLSHVTVGRVAVETMRRHGRGGCLLFNASKSAFNQGPGFGPYAVAKAALVSLMRQYAVDLAKDGIRANAVNADRIRTNLFGHGMAESRAAARGITVDEYFRANMLSREVTAENVADAFAWLAQAPATTGCVVTVDGGNSAAFPR